MGGKPTDKKTGRRNVLHLTATLILLLSAAPAEPERLYRGLSAGPEHVEDLHLNAVFHWGLPAVGDPQFEAVVQQIEKLREKGVTVFVNAAFPYTSEPRFYAEGKIGKQLAVPYDLLGRYADIWNERFAGVAARKVPAVINLASDEITWNNAHIGYTYYGLNGIDDSLPYYPDAPPLRDEFRRRTGLEFPSLGPSRLLQANTPAHRQFLLLRYRVFAEAMARIQETAKKSDPQFQSSLMLNLAPVMGLERYPSGVALDVLGEAVCPDFLFSTVFHLGEDYRGEETHYLAAETAKHLAAACPSARVIPFTAAKKWGESFNMGRKLARAPQDTIGKIPYNSTLRPMDVTRISLSAVGHGADGVCMFGNAASLEPRVRRAVRRAFLAIEKAEPWLAGSRTPPDIVLLYSRAGEDFYGLSHEDKSLDPVSDGSMALREMGGWVQPCNALTAFLGRAAPRTLGFRAHKAAITFLFRNAFPFRMHYLDNLREEELAGARLVLLPFAHSLSREAMALLEAARNRGVKFVFLGPLAEVDPQGEPYPEPLFKPWGQDLPAARGPIRTNGRIAFLPSLDDQQLARSAEVAIQLKTTLLEMLHPHIPVVLEKPEEAEIEVALRVQSPLDQTAIVINWEEEFESVRLGLCLPKGDYRVEVWDVLRSEFLTQPAAITSAEDLQSWPIELAPGGAQIVHVTAVSGAKR
ncbi:MAG: hypothetical protein HYU36_10025 [Planctomycetes bacterium]|nr:hypothetical protein [Planctomycetota bacterium]